MHGQQDAGRAADGEGAHVKPTVHSMGTVKWMALLQVNSQLRVRVQVCGDEMINGELKKTTVALSPW